MNYIIFVILLFKIYQALHFPSTFIPNSFLNKYLNYIFSFIVKNIKTFRAEMFMTRFTTTISKILQISLCNFCRVKNAPTAALHIMCCLSLSGIHILGKFSIQSIPRPHGLIAFRSVTAHNYQKIVKQWKGLTYR